MEDGLFKYLEYEKKLLKELLLLTKDQQKALVQFDLKELENITAKQDESQYRLRKAEEYRIRFITEWLKIDRVKASSMKLSDVAELLNDSNKSSINKYKHELQSLTSELNSINTTNRILANRAKHSVNELLNIFTEGNTVCNVKV